MSRLTAKDFGGGCDAELFCQLFLESLTFRQRVGLLRGNNVVVDTVSFKSPEIKEEFEDLGFICSYVFVKHGTFGPEYDLNIKVK